MNDKQKPSIRFKGFTEDWEQRKFSEVANYRNGKAHENDIDDKGKYVVVNSKFVSTNGEVRKYSNSQIEPLMKNEIAFVLSDVPNGRAIARTFLVDKDDKYTLNQRIAGITPKEKICPYFLHILMNRNKYFLQFDDGAKQTNLSVSDVMDFDEYYPTEKEQYQIGEYFKNLDHLITLHQRKYDKLMNVKKSMLEKMFPRDGKNVPEIRFSGFTEAWEQRKLSEIATMHARIGWQNLRTSEFLDSGNYMLITGTDFEDGAINFDTCHYVERERYEQDKHIQIKNGSILITKDGTLGKVAYVQGLSMPATLNAGVFNVEIKDETKVDNKYLFQYLKAPYLMDYVDKKATGGTIKHLNQNILVDFPVVMPLKQEQRLIGAYFNQLDHLITLHQREVEKLQNIKKSCLEKMFA